MSNVPQRELALAMPQNENKINTLDNPMFPPIVNQLGNNYCQMTSQAKSYQTKCEPLRIISYNVRKSINTASKLKPIINLSPSIICL